MKKYMADKVEMVDASVSGALQLTGYTSTRNDGQLTTNKILGTDANGNLKMYTIATAPAPFLEVLIPDSTLPSTTTNFTLKGAFFTPTMTVTIAGQTINYITFKSDNLVLVNVTTGPTEGSYAVTLNNGIEKVYPNALLIVLGTIYVPITSDWTNVTGAIDLTNSGEVKTSQFGVSGTAKLNPTNIKLNSLVNYRLDLELTATPFDTNSTSERSTNVVSLFRVSDNVEVYRIRLYQSYSVYVGYSIILVYSSSALSESVRKEGVNISGTLTHTISFRKINNIYTILLAGVQYSIPYAESQDMYAVFSVSKSDIKKIKYIETA